MIEMGSPARPTAMMLARVDARMSFLYLDLCQVTQDSYGVVATVESEHGTRVTQIPVATLSALLLGPGTSITNRAVASAAAAGCAVSFVGQGAVRSYGTFLSPYAPTERLVRQANIVSDDELRTRAAITMYNQRFPDFGSFSGGKETIEKLRGIEGARMKATYAYHAKRCGLRSWRRNSGHEPSLGVMDSVNRALNSANAALYGVVEAVILSLGMSPGLGVIHSGNRRAFTLDVADIYKTQVTIPLAFSLRDSDSPEDEALFKLREKLRLVRLIPQIIKDIDAVLGFEAEEDDWDVNTLRLWAREGEVSANRNYANTWTE